MSRFGVTGRAPSQTELEIQESHRLAAERQVRLYGSAPNTNAATIVPLHKPSNDNDEAPKKPKGHCDADVAKAYARSQTNTVAEEAAINGHTQAPSSITAPTPAETTHDPRPPNTQGKPTIIRPTFATFPEELKAKPNWFMWKYMPPKFQGQKWRKVPFQTNGEPARSTDPTTWSSFEECCAAYARGGFGGIGFAFDGNVEPDGLCYVGVDFDHCIENGKLHPLAKSQIEKLNTYTEISVSGTGIHCIARAKPHRAITCKNWATWPRASVSDTAAPATDTGADTPKGPATSPVSVEIYTDKRYFTFTGYSLRPSTQVRDAPAEINALVEQILAKEAATEQQGRSGTRQTNKRNTVLFGPAEDGADDAFGEFTDESLSDEIENLWFGVLSPELKNEVVNYSLGIIAAKTKFLETEANGGDNGMWFKLTTAVAVSDAPDAENIFVKYASAAKNADPEDELRQHFTRCQADANGQITVGTLLGLAFDSGADFDKWKQQIPREKAETLDPDLAEMNSKHCVISDFGGKCVVANEVIDRKNNEKTVTFSSFETIINRYRNRKRTLKTTEKNEAGEEVQKETKTSLGRWWLNQGQRRQLDTVVFAPGRDIHVPAAFNLWRGFKYEPDFENSASKCRLYLKHIHENICQGDHRLFKYKIRWMADAVQNPGKPGNVALVLRGEMGTGKGEFARHFGELFGENFIPVTKAKHITGHFNGHMGKCILMFGDECFNRGDEEQEQILKTLITERYWLIEFKGYDAKRFSSCLHIILAANHDWVVPVRLDDRRFCCNEVGKAHQKDRPYFTAIDNQMRNGGYEALLGLLLKIDLTNWNPEDIPETKERQFQKWLTASDGDKLIIGFAQDGCLPAAVSDRPWIAPSNGGYKEPGLFENMKARGGPRIARMSDQDLTNILKGWKFKAKSLGNGRGWEAPLLPDLRKAILDKYPTVEFDDCEEWKSPHVEGLKEFNAEHHARQEKAKMKNAPATR